MDRFHVGCFWLDFSIAGLNILIIQVGSIFTKSKKLPVNVDLVNHICVDNGFTGVNTLPLKYTSPKILATS